MERLGYFAAVMLLVLAGGCGDDGARPIPRTDGGGGVDGGARDGGGTDAGGTDSGGGGLCSGVDCSGLDDGCNTGTCNTATGSCEATPMADGTSCDDDDGCTTGEACAAGTCAAGTPRDCSATSDMCNTGSCNPATGACEATPIADGTTCDDASACTTGDICAAGVCTGAGLDCSGLADGCNVGVCDAATGACVAMPMADGTTCDDSMACTTSDVCAAGVCGGTAVDCSATSDMCNAGVCDAATGTCGAVPIADGTTCNDSSACTTGDVCTAGSCGGTAVNCSGMNDACNRGTCNPATGACMQTPRADGRACDDGIACTSPDTCTAGVCGGIAAPDGTTCSDSRSCTRADACSGGACLGTAGDLAFLGYANWTQAARTDDNPTQDGQMDTACNAAFPGSHAATVVDITSRRVVGLPASNTSGGYAIGKCPACEGRAHAACVEGTARNCVNPGAAWPTAAVPWTGNDNCHTSGRTAVCVMPRVTFAGYASWTQSASSQSDAAQDTAMDAACAAAHRGSRAVTMDQLVTSTIVGRPASNSTGQWLTGRCPNCQGNAHAGCVSGFARNCVSPGDTYPTTVSPWPSELNCITGTRSTICVRPTRACAFRGFATWTQAATTQSDAAQDAAMNAACDTAFSGSVAASIEEISSGAITGRPATNTSGRHLVGRCPSCEGRAHASCVEGHARNCLNPAATFPESYTPWSGNDNCHSSSRSALCY